MDSPFVTSLHFSSPLHCIKQSFLLACFLDLNTPQLCACVWYIVRSSRRVFPHLGNILTVLKERMANRLAIIVEKPGAKQLCAMKPNFSSARQMTSSPCFQSHDGMFSKYACKSWGINRAYAWASDLHWSLTLLWYCINCMMTRMSSL